MLHYKIKFQVKIVYYLKIWRKVDKIQQSFIKYQSKTFKIIITEIKLLLKAYYFTIKIKASIFSICQSFCINLYPEPTCGSQLPESTIPGVLMLFDLQSLVLHIHTAYSFPQSYIYMKIVYIRIIKCYQYRKINKLNGLIYIYIIYNIRIMK